MYCGRLNNGDPLRHDPLFNAQNKTISQLFGISDFNVCEQRTQAC